MANLYKLPTTQADNGNLTVFEVFLPNPIQRLFLIHGVGNRKQRGGHRHYRMTCALICISGSCRVHVNDGQTEHDYLLNVPDLCLVLKPHEWREMDQFSHDAVLLAIADCSYDPADYIYEPYPTSGQKANVTAPSQLFL